MIEELELCLLAVIILFKIEFRHTQISVPKIGTPMHKTACINHYIVKTTHLNYLLDFQYSRTNSLYIFFMGESFNCSHNR